MTITNLRIDRRIACALSIIVSLAAVACNESMIESRDRPETVKQVNAERSSFRSGPPRTITLDQLQRPNPNAAPLQDRFDFASINEGYFDMRQFNVRSPQGYRLETCIYELRRDGAELVGVRWDVGTFMWSFPGGDACPTVSAGALP